MTRMTDQLDRAVEDGTRVLHALPAALLAMRDAMAGAPGAHAFDAVGPRTRTVLYCERHDQDHADCDPDDLCVGVPVPAHTDPTGDAGAQRDPARDAQRRAGQLVAHIARSMNELVGIVAEWQPGKAPTAKDRKDTERANQKAGGCQCCARAETFSPVHRQAVEVDDATMALCRWCYDFVRKVGRLPHRHELLRHHRGHKVRVPFTDRAKAGIGSGALGAMEL